MIDLSAIIFRKELKIARKEGANLIFPCFDARSISLKNNTFMRDQVRGECWAGFPLLLFA
jgi:hypothetical protein